jgi:maleylpyruvate isomerase
MADGTALFLSHLDSLDDADLDAASLLPGWTRRHLAAHVHFNACALMRLVSWASSGAERRMYDSPHQRAEEIDDGSRWEPTVLRTRVHESAGRLRTALDALPPEAWRAEVVTAQGRTVPASEIPWMRAREVMIHAIDLGTGVTFADLPADFTRALLADVVGKRAAAGEGPDLAAWLTGRASRAPTLGPWL